MNTSGVPLVATTCTLVLMTATFWLIYYSAKEDEEMFGYAVAFATLTVLIVGTQLRDLEVIYATHPQLEVRR